MDVITARLYRGKTYLGSKTVRTSEGIFNMDVVRSLMRGMRNAGVVDKILATADDRFAEPRDRGKLNGRLVYRIILSDAKNTEWRVTILPNLVDKTVLRVLERV